jgi:GT2 family glycosyltransferase
MVRFQELSGLEIAFCIVTFKKTPWLIRSLLSIRKYCPTSYKIHILSQGPPDKQLSEFLTHTGDGEIDLVTLSSNVGCGPGRALLAPRVSSPFTMMLDDDMYLTRRSIVHALRVFERNERIGAVSMPQYDLQDRMLSVGGYRLVIRNGVITRRLPELDFRADWIEVEHVDGGAMLYRTEMNRDFSWDNRFVGSMDDLDKSLQVMRGSRWKQAIVRKGRLIHDRSWVRVNPAYEKTRFNGLAMCRSYRLFRRKWGLRFPLRSHFLYEIAYPALTLTRCPLTVSHFNKLFRRGARGHPF